MCPACMASAALMAGSVITTGLTALVGKIFHTKKECADERFGQYNAKEKWQ